MGLRLVPPAEGSGGQTPGVPTLTAWGRGGPGAPRSQALEEGDTKSSPSGFLNAQIGYYQLDSFYSRTNFPKRIYRKPHSAHPVSSFSLQQLLLVWR